MTLRDAVLVKKKKDLSSFLLDSVVDSMQLDHNKEICQLLLVLWVESSIELAKIQFLINGHTVFGFVLM